MSMTPTPAETGAERNGGAETLNGAVTWLVAVFLVLGGGSIALLGTILSQVASGGWVAEMVAAAQSIDTEFAH